MNAQLPLRQRVGRRALELFAATAYLYPVFRVLAVVDAVAFPALGFYWASTWPKGGMFSSLFATLMVAWAVKRGRWAIFDYENYRWILRWVVCAYLVMAIFMAIRWVLGAR